MSRLGALAAALLLFLGAEGPALAADQEETGDRAGDQREHGDAAQCGKISAGIAKGGRAAMRVKPANQTHVEFFGVPFGDAICESNQDPDTGDDHEHSAKGQRLLCGEVAKLNDEGAGVEGHWSMRVKR